MRSIMWLTWGHGWRKPTGQLINPLPLGRSQQCPMLSAVRIPTEGKVAGTECRVRPTVNNGILGHQQGQVGAGHKGELWGKEYAGTRSEGGLHSPQLGFTQAQLPKGRWRENKAPWSEVPGSSFGRVLT